VTDERLTTARGAYAAGAISSTAAAMSLALFAETCPAGRTSTSSRPTAASHAARPSSASRWDHADARAQRTHRRAERGLHRWPGRPGDAVPRDAQRPSGRRSVRPSPPSEPPRGQSQKDANRQYGSDAHDRHPYECHVWRNKSRARPGRTPRPKGPASTYPAGKARRGPRRGRASGRGKAAVHRPRPGRLLLGDDRTRHPADRASPLVRPCRLRCRPARSSRRRRGRAQSGSIRPEATSPNDPARLPPRPRPRSS
jgi:hypothetical protein